MEYRVKIAEQFLDEFEEICDYNIYYARRNYLDGGLL